MDPNQPLTLHDLLNHAEVFHNDEPQSTLEAADKELVFQLRAPALGAMMVQAILDEIDTFTAAAKAKLPDLLVVTDL
jgi:hypothetical protein